MIQRTKERKEDREPLMIRNMIEKVLIKVMVIKNGTCMKEKRKRIEERSHEEEPGTKEGNE